MAAGAPSVEITDRAIRRFYAESRSVSENTKGQFRREIALFGKRFAPGIAAPEFGLAVESSHDPAADCHAQQPVAGIDGEQVGAAILKDVLRKERRRHESQPADNGDLRPSRERD